VQVLSRCNRKQFCAATPQQIQAVMMAALAQPRLRPRVKADLLTILGIYYAEELRDIPATIRVMTEAVALDPNDVRRRVTLAQALLFLPDYAAAERQLRTASRQDTLRSQQGRIERLQSDIAKFRAARSGAGETGQTPVAR